MHLCPRLDLSLSSHGLYFRVILFFVLYMHCVVLCVVCDMVCVAVLLFCANPSRIHARHSQGTLST